MKKRTLWTYGLVKAHFESQGYQLLSTKYINVKTKLSVKCKRGHYWKVTLNEFQKGTRCPECRKIKKHSTEVQKIVELRAQLRSEGYQVSDNEYTNTLQYVDLICPNGHKLSMMWQNLRKGCRCTQGECHPRLTSTNEVEQTLAKYGYTLLTKPFPGNHKKIKVKCPKGHIWEMKYYQLTHLNCQCKECYLEQRRNKITDIKAYFEACGYTLLDQDYNSCKEKLNVQCPQGHKWQVRWNDFQQGYRCGKCFPTQSKGEKEVIEYFKELSPIEGDRTIIAPKELDIYFPQHKVAVEYCGLYWHNTDRDRITSSYHRDKLEACNQKGIRLLTIFEDEWKGHKEICISRINNALGTVTNRVYARRCIVKEITSNEAQMFLESAHLQGSSPCKIAYGLFYNEKLIQVMTFGVPTRAHTAKKRRVLEMKRLAALPGFVVIGGASKILKFGVGYAKKNNYEVIKSYCDLRWGTGNLYKKLGFIKTYETKFTPHYTDGKQRWRNQSLATNKKKKTITEGERAYNKGLSRIYDCGHSTWEYEVI